MRVQRNRWLQVVLLTALAAILISSCGLAGGTQAQPTNPPGTQAGLPGTGGQANPSKPVALLETGSSLLYPLFSDWAQAIHQAYPNITIDTASTGSGAGISQAASGVVQLGATDAYMSDSQIQKLAGLLNIPLAISAQQINYNLPGIKQPLNLSGPVLAGIYQGKIQYWDDPALKADNPGAGLPHQRIIPVHRTDGSGDTFLFTQYLSDTDPTWKSSIGYNTSINWPSVQGGLGAVGNPGLVQTLAQTQYSIGYVGISFLDEAKSKGLGTANLKNRAGRFLPPDQKNISAAAEAMAPQTPKDERISLIFAPGPDSYPVINYEYVVVQSQQPDPDLAQAIRTTLLWAISPSGGSAPNYLDPVHFLPLPAPVVALSKAQIQQIH